MRWQPRRTPECRLSAVYRGSRIFTSDVSLFVIFHMTIFMGRQPGSWTRDTGTTHALPCTVLSNEVNRYLGSSWVAGCFNQGGVKGLVHCLDRTLLMWFQARKNEKSHKEPQRTTKNHKEEQRSSTWSNPHHHHHHHHETTKNRLSGTSFRILHSIIPWCPVNHPVPVSTPGWTAMMWRSPVRIPPWNMPSSSVGTKHWQKSPVLGEAFNGDFHVAWNKANKHGIPKFSSWQRTNIPFFPEVFPRFPSRDPTDFTFPGKIHGENRENTTSTPCIVYSALQLYRLQYHWTFWIHNLSWRTILNFCMSIIFGWHKGHILAEEPWRNASSIPASCLEVVWTTPHHTSHDATSSI